MSSTKRFKSGLTKEDAITIDESISDTDSSDEDMESMRRRVMNPTLFQIVQSSLNTSSSSEPQPVLDSSGSLPDMSGIIDPNYGYAVVPFPPFIRERFNLLAFLSDQREFIHSDPEQLFVLGGFGALANPSSFHHPMRRQLMNDIFDYMEPIFRRTFQNSDLKDYRYLSMIPDRFGIRRVGQEVGKETWHKDSSMTAEQAHVALVFGGWINLNASLNTYFSCVPADVIPPLETGGFYERKLQQKGGFTAEKERIPELNRRKFRVVVPPNHIVIFNEMLTHEVVKAVTTEPFNYRCYLKWFVSKNDIPYWPRERMENYFAHQSQIGMSRYQPDAPLFASAHSSYGAGVEKLVQFSERIIPELRTFQIKGEKIKKDRLVPRFLGKKDKSEVREGLVDWGKAFPEYTAYEKSIYIPRRMY